MPLWGRRILFFASRAVALALLILAALAVQSHTRYLENLAARPGPPLRTAAEPEMEIAAAGAAGAPQGDRAAPRAPVELTIKRGETLSATFRGLGLAPGEAHAATEALRRYVDPRRLRPGDQYRAYFGAGAELAAFELALAGRGDVRLARHGDAWNCSWRPYERSVQARSIAGTLEESLDAALRSAGANPELAYKMADVLQWDLDFNRDLQPGDRFEVLYEEVFLDGAPYGLGDVLALTYQAGRRRRLEAYRYGEDAYYGPEGQPLRKMFLRSPLPYSRVTSRFSHRRFHPVLKVYRPHWGVDFGAPTGTPVRVTAGGVVVSAGWDRGGGKTVKVRHPNGYLTAYLHLSRFAKGIRGGTRVAQGEVVGYVGSTGLATAAHLDYRVQRHGRWIDPLTLSGVSAPPIPKAQSAKFEAWRDALRVSLRAGGAPPAGEAVLAAAAPSAGSPAAAPAAPTARN
jgi:murein DD-endopeptidase MepM/ murein hydrolase activator NlpD